MPNRGSLKGTGKSLGWVATEFGTIRAVLGLGWFDFSVIWAVIEFCWVGSDFIVIWEVLGLGWV